VKVSRSYVQPRREVSESCSTGKGRASPPLLGVPWAPSFQAPLRTLVIVPSPTFELASGVLQRPEPIYVQAFVSRAVVERSYVKGVCRLPRPVPLHWRSRSPAMARQLERDLPEPLYFFAFPRHLWRSLRTTNVIERCFVEVRRRTRPMVVFTTVKPADPIIYAIFSRFNRDWKNRNGELFTQAD
jgi:hypothetical protein